MHVVFFEREIKVQERDEKEIVTRLCSSMSDNCNLLSGVFLQLFVSGSLKCA